MAVQTTSRHVVMSDRFMEAYDRLPGNVRPRVRERLDMLRKNPAHPSLNYEAIKNAGDPRMRSMRVSDNYRIILAHPDGTGTYVLLWVDTHDAAYTWSMRHRLDPGDERRGLAIITIDERREEREIPSSASSPRGAPREAAVRGVLHGCSDAELADAGVPAGLLPAFRACVTEEALLGLLGALRQEVAEAVLCLAIGAPLPSVAEAPAGMEDPADAEEPPIPASDPVIAALEHPESGRRFVVLASQRELEQALDYPMERWRLFLHPDQRTVVQRRFAGPALVSGGAGTGKTVVGLHRARYLAERAFTAPTDRVLLTTFTRNLAHDLSHLMDTLCGDDEALRGRIDVTHVHALAWRLRRAAGERFGLADDDLSTALLARAVEAHDTLRLSPSFYLAEWIQVAQEREALTYDAYLVADRRGRGRALSRRQRMAIWPVLDAYRRALAEAEREDWPTVLHRARDLAQDGRAPVGCRYRAAIVDEAQDMGAPELRLLLALVGDDGPDNLLLLGDSRQQIYARGSYVETLGIRIGRRHARLRVNYRTTEQIYAAASGVVPAAATLTGESLGRDETISLLSGPRPAFARYPTPAEEEAAVVSRVRDALASIEPREIAVVARTSQLVNRYFRALEGGGIPCARLAADGPTGDGVQVGTMHRVKGLEFRAVCIVGCSADVLPQPYTGEDEAAARIDHEERERRLLYVAMTRARDLLWVSAGGAASPLVARWDVP